MTSREGMSLDQALESFPRGAQELSAARLARDVDGLLHRAFKARGVLQGVLANKLGVSESAVSQVLNSEGNLRISTLGRYLRALGYEAKLHLVPVEDDAPTIEGPQRRRRSGRGESLEQATTQPAQLSTSSREVHWTVLDMHSNVFALNVRLQANAATDVMRFSGTMPSHRYPAMSDAEVRVSRPIKADAHVATSR